MQGHRARLKMNTDPAAEAGTKADGQCPKMQKKKEKKTKREAESAARVKKDATTVKGSQSGVEPPGIEIGDQEVPTGIGLETLTEAGAPEAGAVRETTAKSDRLIERTEKLPATRDAAAAAAAPTAIEQKEGKEVPTLKERLIVLVNPKTEEVQPDQMVQKAKVKLIAGGIGPGPVQLPAPAPALTATNMVFFKPIYVVCNSSFPSPNVCLQPSLPPKVSVNCATSQKPQQDWSNTAAQQYMRWTNPKSQFVLL